jgi:hypothetical protein
MQKHMININVLSTFKNSCDLEINILAAIFLAIKMSLVLNEKSKLQR